MSKFFIADPVHINKKNFGSLYEYLTESKSVAIFNEDREEWMSAFGNYELFQESLQVEHEHLNQLTDRELFDLSTLEINIFKSARAEILCRLIADPRLNESALPSTLEELFVTLLSLDRETVIMNMAAAIQWINFWAPLIKSHNPKFVLIFSGSLIYARTLIELLKNSAPRCFILESFFTGSDNYIEEKYEPIANNSNLKFTAYYNSIGNSETAGEQDRSRNKAINKILEAKNKNVTQPPENNTPLFDNANNIILISGQVINDFSVLEHAGVGINSLAFYKELITKLLQQTNLNIVFKAHPWEREKSNIKDSLTYSALKDYFRVPDDHAGCNGRFILLENYNIKSIFKQTTYVAGINSQSLLEAAFEGFKPIQFGNAFFGRKGFTSDYSFSTINIFISDLKNDRFSGRLGIDGYDSFERFITKALQFSLVSAFPSGKASLRSIFALPPHVMLAKTGSKPAAGLTKPLHTALKVAVKEPAVPAQPAQVNQAAHPKPAKSNRTKKKWIKFLKTPKKFFLDSKNANIRWLHLLFPSFIFK